jgi:hypothetical protein
MQTNVGKYMVMVLFCAILSGCAGENVQSDAISSAAHTSPSAASSAAPTPSEVDDYSQGQTIEQSQAKWTMPTDPYYGSELNSLQQHFLSIATDRCMRDNGYPDFGESWDSNAPLPETLAGDGISQIFNEDLAAKYGYHEAPDARYLIRDEIIASGDNGLHEDETPEFNAQWEKCRGNAQSKLEEVTKREDLREFESSNSDSAIGTQLNRMGADHSVEPLVSKAGAWRECMEPLGIVDLPMSPWETSGRLPESLYSRWNWDSWGTPSADEISVASHDAACRRSSGWFDALYEAEWRLREEFVEKNRGKLLPIVEHDREMTTTLKQAISEMSTE